MAEDSTHFAAPGPVAVSTPQGSGAPGDPVVKRRKLAMVTAIMLVLCLASLVQCYIRGAFMGATFPLNTFLTNPPNAFGDFFSMHDEWRRLGFDGVGYGLSYFPSAYLLLEPFTIIPEGWRALGPFLGVMVVATAALVFSQVRTGAIYADLVAGVLLLACNYGFLFTLHTANVEGYVFLLVALGIWLFARGQYEASAIVLGFPISMKLFPGVFIALFVVRRQWAALGWMVASGLGFSILSLLVFPGGADNFWSYLANLRASQKMYFDLMVLGGPGNHFGHSLLNGWRVVTYDKIIPVAALIKPWLLGTGAAFIFIVWRLYVSRPPFWAQVAVLVCCMNLFPYTSTDYKLLHFLIPVLLYANSAEWNLRAGVAGAVLAVLMAPRGFFYLHNNPYASISIVVTPLLMLFLVGWLLTTYARPGDSGAVAR